MAWVFGHWHSCACIVVYSLINCGLFGVIACAFPPRYPNATKCSNHLFQCSNSLRECVAKLVNHCLGASSSSSNATKWPISCLILATKKCMSISNYCLGASSSSQVLQLLVGLMPFLVFVAWVFMAIGIAALDFLIELSILSELVHFLGLLPPGTPIQPYA